MNPRVRWDVAGLVASSDSYGEYSEKLRGKAAPDKIGERKSMWVRAYVD